MLHAAAHGTRVMKHLLDCDRQRVLITQHDHGQRIAHQDHVDPGFIDQSGAGVVVCGQAGNQFMMLFLFEERSGGDLRAEVAGSDTHDVLQCSSAWRIPPVCLFTDEYPEKATAKILHRATDVSTSGEYAGKPGKPTGLRWYGR